VDGQTTSSWLPYTVSSRRWMNGFATGYVIAYGTTGRSPSERGRTSYDWE